MQTHRIETARTARFLTHGDEPSAREVWHLLHGYGQLAREFLVSCEALAAGRLLVAPGALSRFYLRGGQGRIGASWMTAEDREDEIVDYVRFLDAVAAQVPSGPEGRPTCVLGFSQGAHSACRWATSGATRISRLVLWGGGVPEDVDLARHRGRLGRMRLTLVRGSSDEAYDAGALARDCARLEQHGVPFETLAFEGAHELDDSALRALAES
jgi:predicted esterase